MVKFSFPCGKTYTESENVGLVRLKYVHVDGVVTRQSDFVYILGIFLRTLAVVVLQDNLGINRVENAIWSPKKVAKSDISSGSPSPEQIKGELKAII